MPVTIITKNGSGTPSDSTLERGELAVDLSGLNLFSSTDGVDIVPVGGGSGGGSTLPVGALGDVLINNGADWVPSALFSVDETSTPSIAAVDLTGEITFNNVDLPGSDAKLSTSDFLGFNTLNVEFLGTDGGVVFADSTVGAGNEVSIANGFVTVTKNPTNALHLTTKQYVDSATSGQVPAGGSTNDMLRWNGSAWVVATSVTVSNNNVTAENLYGTSLIQSSGICRGATVEATNLTGSAGQVVQAGSNGKLNSSGISSTNIMTLSDAQTVTGVKTHSAALRVPAGGGTTPGLSFSGDNDTGLWSDAKDRLIITAGGVSSLIATTAGVNIGNAGAYPDGTNTSMTLKNTLAVENVPPTGVGFTALWNVGILGYQSSDLRLKDNIVDNAYGLAEVLAVETIQFDWREDTMSPGAHDVGFGAQPLREIIPEAVPYDEGKDQYGIRELPLIAALFKAVQELNTKIEEIG